MSQIDRKRFQSTSISSMKEEENNAKSKIPKGSSDYTRPGFLKIEDGDNWVRIAPTVNPGEQAYVACSRVSLECEVDEIDTDGKETGKKEIKNKQIFIATVHSRKMVDDPILMYIRYAEKIANETKSDKDERRKFLNPINGFKDKQGKWTWGIKPMSPEYICYAWNKAGELGRLQLFQPMFDAIKKLSTERTPEDSPIIVDVFSQLDEAYPLILKKTKNEKGKVETTVSIDLPKRGESWDDFFKKTELSDKMLAELISQDSLNQIYRDAYTTRDFDMAVDGLMRFDKKHGYNIFDDEEFIIELEELKATCPKYVPRSEKKAETSTEESQPERKTYESSDKQKHPAERKPIHTEKEVEQNNVPVPRMKKELNAYILENYGDEFTLPELTKQELVKWYELMNEGEELPFDEETLKPEPQNQVTKKEVVPESEPESIVDSDLQAQIDLIRKRRSKS